MSSFETPIMNPALDELAEYQQWVCRNGAKHPINPHTGNNASSTDSKTWGSIDTAISEAVHLKHNKKIQGIGFVFTPGDPYTGIDLDKCVDEDGKLEPWAQKIVDDFDSYTEFSPSGKGVHVLIKGEKPGDKCKKDHLEMYDTARYFTVTGHHIDGTPDTINERQEVLAALYNVHFPDHAESRDKKSEGDFEIPDIDLDADLPKNKFEALLSSNEKFRLTWEHERGDLSDQSNSTYDWSLVGFAANAGWSDSEIIGLIVEHRREHGGLEKCERSDYMGGLLAQAQTTREDKRERDADASNLVWSGSKAHHDSVNSVNSTHAGWDDPVIPYCLTPPEIPADLLPSWLGAYARAVSQETQTPEGLSVLMGLSVLATCLQKRFVVSPYGDGYKEPLSLWTVTAMPPASRKTAVLELLTSPLVEWENEQLENLKAEIMDIETKRAVNLKTIDRLQVDASKAKDSLDRKEIIREINLLKEDTPEELIPPRLWTGDITPERLQSLMAEHGERMSLISDEGGIFEIMSGLYSDGRANLDVFLKGHAGQSTRVDRGKRTVILDNPALSFGLAVQPQVLSEFGVGSKKRFRGIGTLARFLYCLPKSNIGQRDIDKRQPISESDRRIYREEIFKLLSIPPILDDTGKESPRIIQLSSKSRDNWLQFSKYIESEQGDGGKFEPIQDWTGKLPGAALRIAGNCHVTEHGDSSMPVKLETMERALDLCQLLIPHSQVSFDLMGVDQDVNDAKLILSWVQGRGETSFKRSDCHIAHHGRFKKLERLLKALGVLQGWNVISAPAHVKPEAMGRTSIVYHVNPAILKEADDGMA